MAIDPRSGPREMGEGERWAIACAYALVARIRRAELSGRAVSSEAGLPWRASGDGDGYPHELAELVAALDAIAVRWDREALR